MSWKGGETLWKGGEGGETCGEPLCMLEYELWVVAKWETSWKGWETSWRGGEGGGTLSERGNIIEKGKYRRKGGETSCVLEYKLVWVVAMQPERGEGRETLWKGCCGEGEVGEHCQKGETLSKRGNIVHFGIQIGVGGGHATRKGRGWGNVVERVSWRGGEGGGTSSERGNIIEKGKCH